MSCRDEVFARADGKCERCALVPPTEWSHVLSRRYASIKDDPANSCAMCHDCHAWAHAHPTAFRTWWKRRIGPEEWIRIHRPRKPGRPTREWADKNRLGQFKRWAKMPVIKRPCSHCGVEFETRGHNARKLCSLKCRYQSRKGTDRLTAKSVTLGGSLRLGHGKQSVMKAMLETAVNTPCVYCGTILTLDNLQVDHKTPLKGLHKNGPLRRQLDVRENLQMICRKCNLAKGALSDAGFRKLLAFLRSDPELYMAIIPRLGMAGKGWQRIRSYGRR